MTRIAIGLVLTMIVAAASAGVHAIPSGAAAEPAPPPQRKASPAKAVGPSERHDIYKSGRPVPPVKREQVLEWRKQYPFESLVGRLAYEAARAPKSPPPLTPEAAEALKKDSESFSFGGHARSGSFKMLHEETVEEFVTASGFGVGRMPIPVPMHNSAHYKFLEGSSIPFDKMPVGSAEGPTLELPPTFEAWRAAAGPVKLLPRLDEMHSLHRSWIDDFADPVSFGYVKSKAEVVGFASHQFRKMPWNLPLDDAQFDPNSPLSEPSKRWKLVRLELTSLLKHDTPRVYLSEHLPRMEDLSSTKTRELSKFEVEALTKLRAGEDIVTAATANRIEMYGSLRAAKQCAQCHEVPQGTLLGAFSYDLRRDPPIKETPSAGAVQ